MDSMYGSELLDIGPASVYIPQNLGSGGTVGTGANDRLFMGGVDKVTLRGEVTATDLVYAQAGVVNQFYSRPMAMVEFALAQATLERWEAMKPGFTFRKTGTGPSATITGGLWHGAAFKRASDFMTPVQIVKLVGLENDSDDPLDSTILWKVAFNPNFELTFDESTQRFVGAVGRAFPDKTKKDADGNATFFGFGTFDLLA